MNYFRFRVDGPVKMVMTGKFVSPSPEWQHMNRILMEYELFIQTRGTLYISCNEKKFALREGEFLLMPPRSHQYGYQASDCSFYWLHFSARGETESISADELEQACDPEVIAIPEYGTLRSPNKLTVMLKQLQDSVRSYREQNLNNYLTTGVLCEIYNQMFFVQNQPAKPEKQQLYNDIVDYIKWYKEENLKVEHLAKHFGYNAKYLTGLFSSIAGISLKQYIMQEKMEAAKFLLTDTNRKITEIANQLGFSNSHSFMKAFKKKTGLTPSEYRNTYATRLLYYK
ncbi:AraC family transcriptional regulator [Paenibacillus cineris]|uniref:AraC family transcriptional regulator n=1 Tax=Paenibacillus cineris TaxID=237530 RepID=UPI001B2DD6A6|nr:AraC family transcriptional regulator [Paenibacillus cineris]GIO59724.1 putative HTH-type transcriptional regulator YisR [Paenibacillus cineris]